MKFKIKISQKTNFHAINDFFFAKFYEILAFFMKVNNNNINSLKITKRGLKLTLYIQQ